MDAAAVSGLQRRVEVLVAGSDGVVGVAVKDLAGDAEVLVNADDLFPTASVMKVPILVALYREVEACRVDVDRRVLLEPGHVVPGSDVLADLAPGLAPTVKDLATLTITVSDNTATDMILELVGTERVAETVREQGMARTQLPLSTRGLLFSMVGLDPCAGSRWLARMSRFSRSPRMRSAPHRRFPPAIRRMRSRVSSGILGALVAARDVRFQSSRNPWRCQRSTVSGRTMTRCTGYKAHPCPRVCLMAPGRQESRRTSQVAKTAGR